MTDIMSTYYNLVENIDELISKANYISEDKKEIKEYQDFINEKLKSGYGVKSIAELSLVQRNRFFKEVNEDWEKRDVKIVSENDEPKHIYPIRNKSISADEKMEYLFKAGKTVEDLAEIFEVPKSEIVDSLKRLGLFELEKGIERDRKFRNMPDADFEYKKYESFDIDDKFIHKKSGKTFVISSKEDNMYHLYPTNENPNSKNSMTIPKENIDKYFIPSKEQVNESDGETTVINIQAEKDDDIIDKIKYLASLYKFDITKREDSYQRNLVHFVITTNNRFWANDFVRTIKNIYDPKDVQISTFEYKKYESKEQVNEGRPDSYTYEADAEDIILLIDNERSFYDRKILAYQNLTKKMKRKVYDPALAYKLFLYITDDAAKDWYKKTVIWADDGKSTVVPVSKEVRVKAAKQMAKDFEDSFENKEYSFMESFEKNIEKQIETIEKLLKEDVSINENVNNAQKLIKIVNSKIRSWNERSQFKIGDVGNLSMSDMDMIILYCERYIRNGGNFSGLMEPRGSLKKVLDNHGVKVEEY